MSETTAAAKPQSGSSFDPVSAGIGAFTGIATTIAGISDMKKRREFEQSLALLDNQQKRQLNEKLLASKSQNERIGILSNSIVEFAKSNQQSADRTKLYLYITAGVLSIAMLTLVVVVKLKKK